MVRVSTGVPCLRNADWPATRRLLAVSWESEMIPRAKFIVRVASGPSQLVAFGRFPVIAALTECAFETLPAHCHASDVRIQTRSIAAT